MRKHEHVLKLPTIGKCLTRDVAIPDLHDQNFAAYLQLSSLFIMHLRIEYISEVARNDLTTNVLDGLISIDCLWTPEGYTI